MADDNANNNANEFNDTERLDAILDAICFNDDGEQDIFHREGLDTLKIFNRLSEKKIRDMSSALGKRDGDEQLIIGTMRLESLIGLMHWVQDHRRIGKEVNWENFNPEDIDTAIERANDRQSFKDNSELMIKNIDCGKLKSAKEWNDWEESFKNLLSVMPSADGFPLSYVIREDAVPNDDETFDDFMDECVTKAPLSGIKFNSDKKRVHQLIKSLTQGESSEQHISKLDKKANGRLDMQALPNFYGGSGNTTRQISKAEAIKASFHYKGECWLKFETFLDSLQEMFNIYYLNGEEVQESQQIRYLLEKIQADHMKVPVETIRAKIELDGNVTYQYVVNYLASQATKRQPPFNRRISEVNSRGQSNDGQHRGSRGRGHFLGGGRGRGGRGRGRGRGGRHGRGGRNRNWILPDQWATMSYEERQAHIKSNNNDNNINSDTKRSIQEVVTNTIAESIADAVSLVTNSTDNSSVAGTTVLVLTVDSNEQGSTLSQFGGRTSQASIKKAIMEKLAKKQKI